MTIKVWENFTWLIIIKFIANFALIPIQAQSIVPHIGYVYPSGAKAGETIEVVIGGMRMREISKGYISGGDVEVISAKTFNPFGKFSNDIKNELRPILKAIETGEDPVHAAVLNTQKMLEKLKDQADKSSKEEKSETESSVNEMLNIVPGERLVYIDRTPEQVVELIKKMSPLEYQCLCKEVFSKQNALQASPAIEQKTILKIKIHPDAKAGIRELRIANKAGLSNPLPFVISNTDEISEKYFSHSDAKNDFSINSFPIILNGTIMPGDVDIAKFIARKGEKFRFIVSARKLVPFIGDAVPGWFQPIIFVTNSKGKILAYCDDYFNDPDPVLDFTAPDDGNYYLHIRDSIYRGREDFIYRIAVEKNPSAEVFSLTEPSLPQSAALTEIQEKEPNNSLQSAQKVPFPSIVKAAFDSSEDKDFFSAKFAKGEKIIIETYARRIGSPSDTVIQIFSHDAKLIAMNDDTKRLNIGLISHHADSYCEFTAAESGEYKIKVNEAQAKSGESYQYYLRIDNPRPDFKVYFYPSALNLHAGSSAPFNIIVERIDGFDGEIELLLKNAPDGAFISGGKIPSGVEKITATLTMPNSVSNGMHFLQIYAVANFAGKKLERQVIPCEELMQAFIYYHYLPGSELIASISDRRSFMPHFKLPEKIELEAGKSANIEIKAPRAFDNKNRFDFKIFSPPEGVKIIESVIEKNLCSLKIDCTADAKAWQGNIIIECYPVKNAKKTPQPLGILPAIPAEIKSNPK